MKNLQAYEGVDPITVLDLHALLGDPLGRGPRFKKQQRMALVENTTETVPFPFKIFLHLLGIALEFA